jgi:hypothetical protein
MIEQIITCDDCFNKIPSNAEYHTIDYLDKETGVREKNQICRACILRRAIYTLKDKPLGIRCPVCEGTGKIRIEVSRNYDPIKSEIEYKYEDCNHGLNIKI